MIELLAAIKLTEVFVMVISYISLRALLCSENIWIAFFVLLIRKVKEQERI